MRNSFISFLKSIILISFTFLVVNAKSQDSVFNQLKTQAIPYVPYFLETPNDLVELRFENVIVNQITTQSGSTITINFDGIQSQTTIEGANKFIFFANIPDNTINPNDIYFLYRINILKPKKNRRILRFQILRNGKLLPRIPLEIKKVKENIFKITVNELLPGEYVFNVLSNKNNTYYSFSVIQ
jgi:hypothetical protein